MKIKTKDLEGDALKWAALTCEGWTDLRSNRHRFDNALVMTTPWDGISRFFDDAELDVLGIIEQQCITLVKMHSHHWYADAGKVCFGLTVRVAVLRSYVLTKLGDEVEVPDILLRETP